jgi:hypothetical protein
MRFLLAAAILAAALPAAASPDSARDIVRRFLGPETRIGAIEASPGPDGDRVRVADVVVPTGGRGAFRADSVEFTVAPGVRPGRFRLTMRLPPELTLVDEAGQPLVRLGIGENRYEGIWVDAYETAIGHQLLWRDLTLRDFAGRYRGTLAAVEVRTEGDMDQPQWSGRVVASARGFEIVGPGETALGIAEIAQEYEGEDVPLEAWAALTREARRLTPGPVGAEQRAAIADLLARLPGLGDRFSTVLRVSGVEVRSAGVALGFAGLAFETALATEDGKAELTLGFGLDGLRLTPDSADYAPDRGGLSLRLAELPGAPLWAMLVDLFRTDPIDPAAAARLDEFLRASGALLKLDAALGGATYSALLASEFAVEPASPRGIAGGAQATIAGLDETLVALERPAAGSAPAARPQALGFARLLKALGAPRAGPDGTVYDYQLRLEPSGRLLLNGKDLAALFAGGR